MTDVQEVPTGMVEGIVLENAKGLKHVFISTRGNSRHGSLFFVFDHYRPIIGVVGFAAAVGIGSVAWYNSHRPVGWEAKERPNVVPKVDKNTDS